MTCIVKIFLHITTRVNILVGFVGADKENLEKLLKLQEEKRKPYNSWNKLVPIFHRLRWIGSFFNINGFYGLVFQNLIRNKDRLRRFFREMHSGMHIIDQKFCALVSYKLGYSRVDGRWSKLWVRCENKKPPPRNHPAGVFAPTF